MPARLVKQPNGLYARFSTVVDDFTHYGMDLAEVTSFFFDEYGRREGRLRAKESVAAADADPSRWKEALTTIAAIHGAETANQRIKQILGS